jgi:hypothetical protein
MVQSRLHNMEIIFKETIKCYLSAQINHRGWLMLRRYTEEWRQPRGSHTLEDDNDLTSEWHHQPPRDDPNATTHGWMKTASGVTSVRRWERRSFKWNIIKHLDMMVFQRSSIRTSGTSSRLIWWVYLLTFILGSWNYSESTSGKLYYSLKSMMRNGFNNTDLYAF